MKKAAQDGSRRDALIRAAYDVIAKRGFEGLRLREVAARARIDHSTLHHYFRTKGDLIAAVLDYATEQFRPAQQPSGSLPTTLREHLRFLGRMMAEKPELHVVLREFDLHAIRDKHVRDLIAQRERGWRTRLAARIRRAAEEGQWPPQLGAVQGAEMIIALVKGASFRPQSACNTVRMFEQLLVQPPARKSAARARRSVVRISMC